MAETYQNTPSPSGRAGVGLHLTLLANRKPLVLDDDFTLTIEDANPLFNDHEMYSYPVTIPLDGNRQFVGNIEDHQSDQRPVDLEHTPMQINVEGIPFRSGTAIISEDERLSNRLSLNIDANEQSFSDLIADLQCRDVPVKDDIVIGTKLSKVHVVTQVTVLTTVSYSFTDLPDVFTNRFSFNVLSKANIDSYYEPQALGYSAPQDLTSPQNTYVERYYGNNMIKVPVGQRKYINVSAAYGDTDLAGRKATYCNARVCYKHYAIDSDGNTSDNTVTKKASTNTYEDIYPYWVLDADRPQSGICFYVLYFLECLFKHIGYSYDISDLLKVEDLKRLCFYTTRCKYDIRESEINDSTPKISGSVKQINEWLDNHGCGGNIDITKGEEPKSVNSVSYGGNTYSVGSTARHPSKSITINVREIQSETILSDNAQISAYILPMYANSDNFPDMSVTSLLDSLTAQFGIKFIVDEDKHHVRATFYRDVFRNTEAPITLPMQIDTCEPISEKITGVKVGYSDEADSKEQRDNIRYGKRDYNTDYDYCDYPKEHTVYRTDLYKDIFRSPSNNDMRVYVDLSTGNRYRIKVDGDATQISNLHPVIYEVGQYHGVEFGDCREINADYIQELRSDLQPVPLNDVNYYREMASADGTISSTEITVSEDGKIIETVHSGLFAKSRMADPILVPYCDEDMEHEFVEQRINNVISEGLADAYLTCILRLQESYDPSKTDDGNSPLQKDGIWGNAIAIMRGGGDDDGIILYDNNYDGFNNAKWRGSVENYQISTDSITQFGEGYDYHIKNAEQFSLKPRAYISPDWYHPEATAAQNTPAAAAAQPQFPSVLPSGTATPTAQPQFPSVLPSGTPMVVADPAIRNRGYVDRFLLEYIHFLLHRKPYVITGKIEPALLADIPNNWLRRYRIGDMIGYINRITYQIDVKTGIRKAEVYFYKI